MADGSIEIKIGSKNLYANTQTKEKCSTKMYLKNKMKSIDWNKIISVRQMAIDISYFH